MATKTKKQLKDVFNGLSSVLFQDAEVDLSAATIAFTPEYDLPVTLDSLSISQADPTINHYKVVGIPGDWCSSAQAGDMSIAFTVPTKGTDVLKLAYGNSAVKSSVAATLKTEDAGSAVAYGGTGITLGEHKVTGSIILVNDDDENKQLLVVNNVALWAKPLYENPGTAPFAIQFTGTVESDGSNPDFLFLSKNA